MTVLSVVNDLAFNLPVGAGLNNLWQTILKDWIVPVYLAAIAVFAIAFLKDRKWRELASFIGIAAIVGCLILAGRYFFGSENSGLTGAAKNVADEVNTILFAYTPLGKLF